MFHHHLEPQEGREDEADQTAADAGADAAPWGKPTGKKGSVVGTNDVPSTHGHYCGLDTTVHQVIAIPGWTVIPGNFYNPRVVSAEAVATSFLHCHEDQPPMLKPKEIKNVVTKLREMNRTADW